MKLGGVLGGVLGAVLAGLLLGAVPAAVAWAPASLMAHAVHKASAGHVLLADAEGTLWKGNAVLALTNGTDQPETTALPGRLNWRLGWHQGLPALWLQQPCCVNGQLLVHWRPGLNQQRIAVQGGGLATGGPQPAPGTATAALQPAPSAQQTPQQPQQQPPQQPPQQQANEPPGTALLASAAPMAPGASGTPAGASMGASWGQWPASVLVGLGPPWNTLRPSGSMQLSSQQLELQLGKGQLAFVGQLELVLSGVASRVSTLDSLGDYRLNLSAVPGGGATLELQTLRGALQLQGSGQWLPTGLRFSGQASAAPGSEAVLNNLLNIIGRREGAVSLFSIG